MPRRPKVPNFLTLPSAAAASPRRRPHVAAVALSAADTRRRMGARRLRHRSGTAGVSVRPQQQLGRDGSSQGAARDVRGGALSGTGTGSWE